MATTVFMNLSPVAGELRTKSKAWVEFQELPFVKRLQVLGTGCAACDELASMTFKVATELNLEFSLERVSSIAEILTYDILSTPALVVDDEVKVYGRVPSARELKKMLTEAAGEPEIS